MIFNMLLAIMVAALTIIIGWPFMGWPILICAPIVASLAVVLFHIIMDAIL
jgi:hypothetical protein